MKIRGITKKIICFALTLAIMLPLALFMPSYEAQADGRVDREMMTVAPESASFAIRADGALYGWGSNWRGRLGIGDQATAERTGRSHPNPVRVLDNVASVSVGSSHTMAIRSDGSLWGWGDNTSGQIGDRTVAQRISPVHVMDNVAAVQAAISSTFAITTDGGLYAWGGNYHGELGTGRRTRLTTSVVSDGNHMPRRIMDNVIAVSSSGQHTLAIRSDGSLWGWGNNWHRQLTDSSEMNILSPIRLMDNVAAVSAGRYVSMIIRTDGSLWAVGRGDSGALGDGTTGSHQTPIRVMENVSAVSTNGSQTFAIRTDGSLWGWGGNAGGAVGDGTTTRRPEPVRVMDNVAAVITEGYASFAIRTDGTLWAWGSNAREFGATNWGHRSPIQIMDNIMLPGGRAATPSPRPPVADVEAGVTGTEVGVLIRWTGHPDAIGWRIFRSETRGERGTVIYEGGPTPTEFVDVNVSSNTRYFYTIVKLTAPSVAGQPPTETVIAITGAGADGVIEIETGRILGADREGERGFILMTIDDPMMSVNGAISEIDPGRGTVPIVIDGRTLMPIRAAIEAMGGSMGWSEAERRISLESGAYSVNMWVNQRNFTVNGVQNELDVPPQIINERTMMPIRFVAENIGCEIAWVASTRQIIIVYFVE